MPRTKGKRAPTPPLGGANNGWTDEVLTLAEAAAYLRLPVSAVVGLAHTQSLPGRYVTDE